MPSTMANPLASAGNISRILDLANKPAPKTILYEDEDLRLKTKYGQPVMSCENRSINYGQINPFLTVDSRVRSEQDAVRLQLNYLTMYERFAEMTPAIRRTRLLDGCTYKDNTGALCTYVSGYVCDFRQEGNRITRICLMSPVADSRCRFPTSKPVDTHLWLWVNRLRKGVDLCNPIEHWETLPKREGSIHIGEMFVAAGRLRSYTDSHGRRRLGIGEWHPASNILPYAIKGADGSLRAKYVPRHLIRHMTVARFHSDDSAEWADADELADEICHWKSMYPESAEGLDLLCRI